MIEYRKACVEDVDELIRKRIEFLSEAQTNLPNYNNAALESSLKEYLIKNMEADRFVSWIAVENGAIIGTSGICFYTLPPSYKNISGKVAYIMNMYTLPEYRGNRIAPTLFEKLITEAKDRGCYKISLHATDMGRPVYLKFGFKETHDELVLKLY